MKTTFRSWFLVILLCLSTPVYSENQMKIPDYNENLWGIRFLNPTTAYVIGTQGRIFKILTENQVIVPINTGFNTYLYAVHFLNENLGFAVGANGLIIKTIDGGETWNQIPMFTNQNLRNIQYENNCLYALGSFGTRWKSSNLGETWDDLSVSGFNGHFFEVSIPGSVGYMVSDNSTSPFWKTTDGGTTWTGFSLPSTICGTGLFSAPSRIEVIGKNRTTQQPAILRSVNGGDSWEINYFPTDGLELRGIDYGLNSGFAVTSSHLLKSSKIYKTNDEGQTWGLLSERESEFYSMACSGNHLYLTGDSGTIYQQDIIVSINPISSEIPEGYKLSQNYPNPFNPTTTINFFIPAKTQVTLVIYDMTGKEIETLVNSVLSAGSHSFNFTADNIASGAYIYRLSTESYTETKTMILNK